MSEVREEGYDPNYDYEFSFSLTPIYKADRACTYLKLPTFVHEDGVITPEVGTVIYSLYPRSEPTLRESDYDLLTGVSMFVRHNPSGWLYVVELVRSGVQISDNETGEIRWGKYYRFLWYKWDDMDRCYRNLRAVRKMMPDHEIPEEQERALRPKHTELRCYQDKDVPEPFNLYFRWFFDEVLGYDPMSGCITEEEDWSKPVETTEGEEDEYDEAYDPREYE